ncbi:winged helix-turn-helix transcriptional regulator [Oryzibacter oryziterrae]|uniref:winged helix-turn-helix transcriptional regulator n=1 Tax=Oryzibacter oryziterrae TaxID=2766474 RepID=UPI001F3B229E|nr:helix-turn-helix domain-containing protein [Oryzibacter oryziterrae]
MKTESQPRAHSSSGLDCPPEILEGLEAVQRGLKAVSGKWKGEILCLLLDGPRRFNELKRGIPRITQHMLAAQLKELEKSGLIVRHAFDEMPPRVEYEMSNAGHAFRPVAAALHEWAVAHLPS